MNKPYDIVLKIWIPECGKTTFCRERLFPSHLYISLDQLRARSAEAELFAFALKRHKPCVIDNTNVTAAERRRNIPPARKDKDACIVVYCFASGLEGCLARNEKRTGRAHVPEVVIRCKLAKFEPPNFGEGIDEIYDMKVSENGFDVRRRNQKEWPWQPHEGVRADLAEETRWWYDIIYGCKR